jgi:trigger factor
MDPLKIESTNLDDHQIKLSVEIETDILESCKQKAAKTLAKKVKIPGFRPGKAPYNVIQKHIGDSTILENAIDILLDEIYPQVIEEAEVAPYGPGKLENIQTLDPLTLEFLIPLAPIVTLENYRDIRIDYEERDVTEQEIDQVLDGIRDDHATIEPVDRPAKEGDMVYIVLNGEKKDEKDNDKKVIIEDRSYPVIIEKEEVDSSSEFPYPGFSRNLIGLSPGDEESFEYRFPEDYKFDDLSGVIGIYHVKVEEVKGRKLPKLNDEFAKSIGEYETVEDLRSKVRVSLGEMTEREQNKEYEDQIIDTLLESAKIKYPPQMLEHEIDHFIHDLERQVSSMGMNIDLYLKSRKINMEALREEIKPNAEDRMKRNLILSEVAGQEEISLTPEEVEDKTQQTLNEIQQHYSKTEAQKFTREDIFTRLVQWIVTDEITARTRERLRKIAKGEEINKEEETSNKLNDGPESVDDPLPTEASKKQ